VNLLDALEFAFLHETGHEVRELDPSLLGFEDGRENVRVALVDLLCRKLLDGRQLESSTFPYVEYGCKHARRVEPRCAIPVDGSVESDQSGGVHVSNDAIIADRLVILCQIWSVGHESLTAEGSQRRGIESQKCFETHTVTDEGLSSTFLCVGHLG